MLKKLWGQKQWLLAGLVVGPLLVWLLGGCQWVTPEQYAAQKKLESELLSAEQMAERAASEMVAIIAKIQEVKKDGKLSQEEIVGLVRDLLANYDNYRVIWETAMQKAHGIRLAIADMRAQQVPWYSYVLAGLNVVLGIGTVQQFLAKKGLLSVVSVLVNGIEEFTQSKDKVRSGIKDRAISAGVEPQLSALKAELVEKAT